MDPRTKREQRKQCSIHGPWGIRTSHCEFAAIDARKQGHGSSWAAHGPFGLLISVLSEIEGFLCDSSNIGLGGSGERCGSATRRSRRLRASDQLYTPAKHRNITCRVFVSLLHPILWEHLITGLISHFPLLTDPRFNFYTIEWSLSLFRHIFPHHTQDTPFELFTISMHSRTYLLWFYTDVSFYSLHTANATGWTTSGISDYARDWLRGGLGTHRQHCCGAAYLPICLCVAAGLLGLSWL
jgi:hypothetical protein